MAAAVALIGILAISVIGVPVLLYFMCTIIERRRLRWTLFALLLLIWLFAIPVPLIVELRRHPTQPPEALISD
jgi:hypothetical protein